MGAEAIVAGSALLGAATGVAGLAEQRKAGKRARYEAQQAENEAAETKKLAATEKQRLTDIEKENKKRLAQTRRRLRGGLFGEETESSATLG